VELPDGVNGLQVRLRCWRNTVVLKPAATTPLTTLRFRALVKDLVPPGVLNVIVDANDLAVK